MPHVYVTLSKFEYKYLLHSIFFYSEANNQRLLLGDSGQIPLPGKGTHSHGTVSSKHGRLDQK